MRTTTTEDVSVPPPRNPTSFCGPLRTAPGAVEILSASFDRTSMERLRPRIAACVGPDDLDDLERYKFVLAVTEVTSNAVRHGGGRGHLRIWREPDRWLVEVADHGRGIPRGYREASFRRQPGRISKVGLWLVHEICDDVDIVTGSTGTTVLLSMSLRGDRTGTTAVRTG